MKVNLETSSDTKTFVGNPEINPVSSPAIAVNSPEELIAKGPESSPKILLPNVSSQTEVSAYSITSIRAKKELLEVEKSIVKKEVQLPTQVFSETDMLLYWNKYAQRLGDKGHKIMESLLLINDPVLTGTSISLELPNQGSKIDFETEKSGLLGYLKGHLHNHNITIEVIVNEKVATKQAFTVQEKYNRLSEKNPNLDLLRKTFDLDL